MQYRARFRCLVALIACAMVGLGGCSSGRPELVAPHANIAPYNTEAGELLWAIVPLRNESGTTEVEPSTISDKVVAAVEEIRGVRALPLNRTIEGMRALGLSQAQSPGDVRRLAQVLGVDGVVVGSITAYDPYVPTLGLSLALFARPGGMGVPGGGGLNPRQLTVQPSESGPIERSNFEGRPVAVASEMYDGKNHQVQMEVRAYAEGRHDTVSALGWRRYLASSDLYAQFAAADAVGKLVKSEWIRLANPASAQQTRLAPVISAPLAKAAHGG